MSIQLVHHALAIAAEAHYGQVRKGKLLPYLAHPMNVAMLVAKRGGSSIQIAASLLHDVIEDCGEEWRQRIYDFCGAEVLDIVLECSDCMPVSGGEKAPWRERKEAYIEAIQFKSDGALLVLACDKLSNLSEIVDDLDDGQDVMSRFNADRDEVIWYYSAVAEQLLAHGSGEVLAIARELEKLVLAMEALSA